MKIKLASKKIGAFLGAALSLTLANGEETVPVGWLEASPKLVRAGTYPNLEWEINYPVVENLVTVPPDNTIVPLQELTMKVRILGASFQYSATQYLYTQLWYKKNNGSWQNLWYGKQNQVNPSEVRYQTTVRADDTLYFGARGYRSGWLPFYYSTDDSPNMIVLKDGDSVPSSRPAFYQGSIESFLQPYLDDNRVIDIGPRDVIILYELGQTNPSSSGFDMQDLVALITFE
ncbi:MAG: hypothetical protein Q7Q71_15570 [Verrucomicrobiota bacterium JB023]|nr:hypothetical protein [Verrucomicrobiota bacterium JB023]